MTGAEERLLSLVGSVGRADEGAAAAARGRWSELAKPLGGLGVLEDDVCVLAAAQGTAFPDISRRSLAVFCADNGIVDEGVSQTGRHVTAAVARSLCAGTSSVCAMARVASCRVVPVDVGIASEVDDPRLLRRPVMRGTRNFLLGDAMTRGECAEAFLAGAEVAEGLSGGSGILLAGEMGIGNTTTSSAVLSVLLGLDPSETAGRGAGLSDEGLSRKVGVIRRGIALRRLDPGDPLAVVAKVGGLDVAAMAGFFIGAAACRRPAVVDGLIACAAALAAVRLCPAVSGFLVASHEGAERACAPALAEMGLRPAIRAGLRLGEGTGAVAMLPLLDMALEVYGKIATFGEIGVEKYKEL